MAKCCVLIARNCHKATHSTIFTADSKKLQSTGTVEIKWSLVILAIGNFGTKLEILACMQYEILEIDAGRSFYKL